MKYCNRSFFLFFLLLAALCLNFSTDRQSDPSRVDGWINKGKRLYPEDPREAIHLWDSAVIYARAHRLWPKYLEALHVRMIDAMIQSKLKDWKGLLVRADSVLNFHGRDLGTRLDSFRMANDWRWGNYYYDLGLFTRSLERFESVSAYLHKQRRDPAICLMLYSTHQYISVSFQRLGAYDSAIQEAKNSLQYYECYRNKNKAPNYTQPYLQIAEFYLAKGDLEQAGFYYRAGLKSLKANLGQKTVRNRTAVVSFPKIARYYLQCHQLDSTLHFLNQTLRYLEDDDPFGVNTFTLLGDTYLEMEDTVRALQYYRQAQDRYRSLLGDKNSYLAAVNRKIGTLMEAEGKNRSALAYYQQSVSNLLLEEDLSEDLLSNPNLEKVLGNLELIKTLHAKSGVLLKIGRRQPDQLYLEKAAETNSLAIRLVEESQHDLIQEQERRLQISHSYPVFETGLEIEYYRAQNGPRTEAVERAFILSDQSKSITLLEVISQVSALHGTGSQLLEEERQIKTELAKIKQQIFERYSDRSDTSRISHLIARRDQLEYEYLNWIRRVQQENPAYFELKLKQESVPVQRVREELLEPGQALIEFFWGENALFTTAVSRDTLGLWRQEVGTIADSLQLFYILVEDPASRERVREQKRLRQLAFFLFRELLEKPLALLGDRINKLLIVRDGQLGHLPFEILLPELNDSGRFDKEQFLANDYILAYANSASLLLQQQKMNKEPPPYVFAGFAPGYENWEIKTPDTSANAPLAFVLRSGFFPLKGAERELKAIKKLMGGKLFTKSQATEGRFKKEAGQYQILHLAMHALANDEDPLFSELLFSPTSENEEEDGRLKAIELYNLRLNAQMAVLSACNTGYGQWQRGEGIVCLGHAFAYAGVPSIIMSQWKIPDEATAKIMEAFYTYLKAGKPKDEALALAKRSFLERHPEMSHPFFWGGFVAFGDTAPVDLPENDFPPALPTALLIAVLMVIFLIFWRKR